MRVDNLHGVLANQFELHHDDVVLDVFQVQVLVVHILHQSRVLDLPTHEFLHSLLALVLNQKLVFEVAFGKDLVKFKRVLDWDELRNGASLHDFLPPSINLPTFFLLDMLRLLDYLVL